VSGVMICLRRHLYDRRR